MGSFREHGVLIYLSKDLYKGFIKLQADRDLGRSYAGLLPFTEGLYKLGYISKEVYDEHVRKYSKPLGSEKSQAAVLSLEQQKEALFLEQKNRQFDMMLEQWNLHSQPEWRKKTIALAEKYADKLSSARKILELNGKDLEGDLP